MLERMGAAIGARRGARHHPMPPRPARAEPRAGLRGPHGPCMVHRMRDLADARCNEFAVMQFGATFQPDRGTDVIIFTRSDTEYSVATLS